MTAPRPITAADMEFWADLEPRAVTFAADDPTFEACPAIVTRDANGSDVGGGMVVRVPIVLDEIELTHLARGGTLWFGTFGGLPPFQVTVQAP